MNEHDLRQIEEMFQQHVGLFKEDIKAEFHHQLGIQAENFQHKLDIVVEGHQMLAEKIDRVETRIDQRMDNLEKRIDRVEARLDQRMDGLERQIYEVDASLSGKIDAVAANLNEHRADTEVHKKMYKVNED